MAFLDKIFGKKHVHLHMNDKVKCNKCGTEILPTTANKYKGKCAPCAHGRDIAGEKRQREEIEQARKQKQRKLEQEWEKLLCSLPQKALLALTARCVRRIYSLVKDIPNLAAIRKPIEETIVRAEKAAGGTAASEDFGTLQNASATHYFSDFFGDSRYQLLHSLMGLAGSMLALRTMEYEDPNKTTSLQSIVGILVNIDYIREIDFGKPFPEAFTKCLRQDLELIKENSHAQNWTDDTPVPSEFFGSLWPDGPPRGWPI